jgi:hypothetical protein
MGNRCCGVASNVHTETQQQGTDKRVSVSPASAVPPGPAVEEGDPLIKASATAADEPGSKDDGGKNAQPQSFARSAGQSSRLITATTTTPATVEAATSSIKSYLDTVNSYTAVSQSQQAVGAASTVDTTATESTVTAAASMQQYAHDAQVGAERISRYQQTMLEG